MKIIATIIPTDLVTKLLLSSSYPFLQTKTRIWFSTSWWSGNEKYLFFVYSELQSTSKTCRIQLTFMQEFSYMLFLFVL